jgi:putative nucleotidyltransferase with HDIG domain
MQNCVDPENFNSIQSVICWGLSQIAHPFDPPQLIKILLKGLRDTTKSGRADLLLYQADMNILFFSESDSDGHIGSGQTRISLADSKNSAPVQALVGGHTVLVEDMRESGLQSLTPGSRTLMGVPVIFGDRIHGVLNIEHPEPDAFDIDTARWIEALSSIFAILLEQSYLGEQVFRLNQRLIDQITENASKSDPGYRAHAQRVSTLAVAIAEKLGLGDDLVTAVRDSGYLHDVGKSGVSEDILVKPGNLTEDEFREMKKHPVLGRFLLKPLGFKPAVIEGVVSHHERWDGAGYPRGLSGEQIPITGRILAVAEAYDVMTSDQPYRDKMNREDAIADIKNQSGTQFDPAVVEALNNLDLKRY